jgi:hypothetical protein
MFWTSSERSDPKPSTTGMTSGHRDPGAALPKPEVYHNPSYFPHISAELLSISPVSAGLTPSSYTSHTCCTSPVPGTLYISLHAVNGHDTLPRTCSRVNTPHITSAHHLHCFLGVQYPAHTCSRLRLPAHIFSGFET